MTPMQALLAHYRALADEHRNTLASLESGRVRIYDGPSINNDITPEWIKRYKDWIIELEDIVAKYGDKDA